MAFRWLTVCGVGLFIGGGAAAQDEGRPTELPPLLKPPAGPPNAQPPAAPPGPAGEYDHNHLYLPEYAPPPQPAPPEKCRPLGTWWVNTSLEFAWAPTRPAPGTVRLRVPTPAGTTIPGPLLPAGGVTTPDFRSGFGLTFGRWLGEAQTHGIDASLFLLGQRYRTFTGLSPEMMLLFPEGSNRSVPQVVVFPPGTQITGFFPATVSTWFIGADVNYRQTLLCTGSARLDALAGYRFAFVRDDLFVGDVPDPEFEDFERNRAAVRNSFHGGQIGLAGEFRGGPWYVGGAAKVAFGALTPRVTATGLFVGAEGADDAGGFTRLAALAGPTQTRFAVLPTVTVNVGRQFGEAIRVFAGYSFQQLNGVTRLGDVLDPASGPNAATTDYWIQSVNLGFEVRY